MDFEQEIMQSNHQFIYGEKGELREKLIQQLLESYPLTPGKNTPSVVRVSNPGLPIIKERVGKDNITLSALARDYLEYTMELCILRHLKKRQFLDEKKRKDFFEKMNGLNPNRFTNSWPDTDMSDTSFDDLIYSLRVTQRIYKSMYEEYLKTGAIKERQVPIVYLPFQQFLDDFNRLIDNKSYIAFLIDYQKPMALKSIIAINNLVCRRMNKVASIKIFCGPADWPTYCCENRNFIEHPHDYGEVKIDDSYDKYVLDLKQKKQI